MYLAVLAVEKLPSGTLQLAQGPSQNCSVVLDYVVEMVQFPQSALLSNVALRQELTAELVDDVRTSRGQLYSHDDE